MTSGRVLIRYKENAERLDIPLQEYLEQGQSGKRYCSKCLKWKLRRFFREFETTKTYYSGICKTCTPGHSVPAKVNPSQWGPALRAAKKIGIDVKEYLEKRQQNFRWCTDHKDWFDATDMLEGTNPSITRCKGCNRTRQQELRITRKRRVLETNENG